MLSIKTVIGGSAGLSLGSSSSYLASEALDDDLDGLATTLCLSAVTCFFNMDAVLESTKEMTAYIETMSVEEISQGLESLDLKEFDLPDIEITAQEGLNSEKGAEKVYVKVPKQL